MNLEQEIRNIALKNNIDLTQENRAILLRVASVELADKVTPKEILTIIKQICF